MHIEAKPSRQLKRLDAKQMYQLTQLVDKHYSEKGLSDKEFAKWVSETLGTEVSDSSIATARNTLGLPSTKECTSAGGSEVAALRGLVVNLTERVRVLEIAVHALAGKAAPTLDEQIKRADAEDAVRRNPLHARYG